MTREQFTQKFYPLAKKLSAGTGIFPETILAAAIIESRTGDSLLAKKYNNYFGIKTAGKWKGASVSLNTKEYLNNTPTTIKDAFRVYTSPAASFKDYINFITKQNRYKEALSAPNYQEQIIRIANAGYATAPDYADVLTSVAQGVEKFIPAINELIKSNKLKLLIAAGLGFLFYISQRNTPNT